MWSRRPAGAGATAFLVVLLCLACSETPAPERWWKGNLHAHSLFSRDGDEFPELVVEWYRDHGYHFLGISDHNSLMASERWVPVREVQRRTQGQGMARYLERLGEAEVELSGTAPNKKVRLRPFSELADRYDEPSRFLLMPSQEVTTDVHLNVSNLVEEIVPREQDDPVGIANDVLRAAGKQQEKSARPLLVSLSHPRWQWSVTPEQMAAMQGLQLFEIHNPSPWILGDAAHPSAEAAWDIANTLRIREMRQPPFLGMATDDAHHFYGGRYGPGSAWIMVRSRALTRDAIVAAIQSGSFYATSGVLLDEIRFDSESGELAIDIRPGSGAGYTTDFVGTRLTADGEVVAGSIGVVLATVEGEQPRYRLTRQDLYVRAVVRSSRPVEVEVVEGLPQQAWISPVGWERQAKGAPP